MTKKYSEDRRRKNFFDNCNVIYSPAGPGEKLDETFQNEDDLLDGEEILGFQALFKLRQIMRKLS